MQTFSSWVVGRGFRRVGNADVNGCSWLHQMWFDVEWFTCGASGMSPPRRVFTD